MALVLDCVPESISRAEMVSLLARIGIDASQARSVRFDRDWIEAEVYALDDEGRKFAVGDEIAINRIVISITD